MARSQIKLVLLLLILLLSAVWFIPDGYADYERPNVAYTGVFLMGNEQIKSKFPVYTRNQGKLSKALMIEMEKVNGQGMLPFNLLLYTDMEHRRLTCR